MTTTDTLPNIQIVRNTESIASCNACGQENYVRTRSGEGKTQRVTFEPSAGVILWDLRICPNGAQTFVTKLCADCLEALHGAIGVILKGEQNNVSYRK